MNWIQAELSRRRLTEKKKDSSIGTVKRFVVKVSINGTTMQTAVFAENFSRAKIIAGKLYGKSNVKTQPVQK